MRISDWSSDVCSSDLFGALTDAAQRDVLAADFMAQLATLHRIDLAAQPVEGMGPVEPAETFARRRIADLRAGNSGRAWDPLIHLSLDWLEANMPADMPRSEGRRVGKGGVSKCRSGMSPDHLKKKKKK